MYDCLLKKYRLKNNLTQEELAFNCHISKNLISDYENLKSIPNLQNADILAFHLNVSIYELFHLVSEDYNYEMLSHI